MPLAPLITFFGSLGFLYGILLPLVLLAVYAIVLMASRQSSGARVTGVAEACYSYILQAVGVFLMAVGAFPTFLSVLAGIGLTPRMYFAFLLVFVGGGLLFLWQEQHAQRIDAASRLVPQAIFLGILKTIGHLTIAGAFLVLITSPLLASSVTPLNSGWWAGPVVFLFFGLLLSWCTYEAPAPKESSFQSVTLLPLKRVPAVPMGPMKAKAAPMKAQTKKPILSLFKRKAKAPPPAKKKK